MSSPIRVRSIFQRSGTDIGATERQEVNVARPSGRVASMNGLPEDTALFESEYPSSSGACKGLLLLIPLTLGVDKVKARGLNWKRVIGTTFWKNMRYVHKYQFIFSPCIRASPCLTL